ncbi:MAG: LytTR family DNA-binding domain-containing protein [Flavobacteriales bacterium]|nr:LytTR family DNA-binding domain-containing protein [Flavobacteriales bacterium]
MKALIVDDEKFCRDNLKILLSDYCPEVEEIKLASNATEARISMEANKPDILFLDVMMPSENGFDLLTSLEKKPKSIVFTTAHNEYALQAIKAEAIDYLEKPINIDDLQNAVDKASKRTANTSTTDEIVKQVLKEIHKKSDDERIAIPMREGFELIPLKDIVHMEASESYTMIYLSNGKRIVSSKNIKVYEEKLDSSLFFRTHKSHIINVKHHLVRFSRIDGNSAVMTNGTHVPISRRKLQSFLEEIVGSETP